MEQRVCIAISTATEPQLIIADEPTSALDVISQKQFIETLVATQQRIGSKADLYRQMEEACAAVGLDAGELPGRFPHELSGGQR